MPLGEEFNGIPMESLIGAPLKAASDANLQLAQTTSNFINEVGFDGDNVRTASFAYTVDNKQQIIDVPLLAVVQIPSLKVDLVDITFDMEIKTSESTKSTKDQKLEFAAKAKYSAGLFSVEASVSGSVASHQENTRSTDKSAKYHVQVKATDSGMPEGLARVLDIMNRAIVPPEAGAAPAS